MTATDADREEGAAASADPDAAAVVAPSVALDTGGRREPANQLDSVVRNGAIRAASVDAFDLDLRPTNLSEGRGHEHHDHRHHYVKADFHIRNPHAATSRHMKPIIEKTFLELGRGGIAPSLP